MLECEGRRETPPRSQRKLREYTRTMPRRPPVSSQQSTIKNETAAADTGNRTADPVSVADRLHSAAIHLLRRVRKQDIATGEGPARLSALSVLVFGGPKTLKELAAAEQVKPPTMSRIVAGLVRSHLVTVAADPDDAR